MSARASSARDGFVLVELLVALSVVAVMAGMMAGVFGQLQSVARLREQLLVRAELEGALSHLERSLAGVRPARLPDNRDEENRFFDGRTTQMRFAAVTRQGFYSLALRDVDIHVDMQGEAPRIVQTTSLRRPPDAVPEPTTIIVLDRFDALGFSYSEDGTSFSPVFNRDGAVPKLVRITLSRAVMGKTVTASTVARVH